MKKELNGLIEALEFARNLDEAWEIEEAIIELENKIYTKWKEK